MDGLRDEVRLYPPYGPFAHTAEVWDFDAASADDAHGYIGERWDAEAGLPCGGVTVHWTVPVSHLTKRAETVLANGFGFRGPRDTIPFAVQPGGRPENQRGQALPPNPLICMVSPTGFEPVTR